jgi:EAL domain-containing protein (putative c-di-GMP-specific phosphodiesterase class I)
MIRNVLSDTGLAAQYLELEVTESVILTNADMMLALLRELKQMGVRLSIDDFGTGYSSLSYLKHFPFHKLKIDRSFVRDLILDPDDTAITGAIINLAKNLDLGVVAEGVENEQQMAFLRQHGCDDVQGYYFSKPLPAHEFAEFMRARLEHPHSVATTLSQHA